jgi:hypothetical protein
MGFRRSVLEQFPGTHYGREQKKADEKNIQQSKFPKMV